MGDDMTIPAQQAVPGGDYEILDPRFRRLVIPHAKVERLWTGGRWTEGPVYVPSAKSVIWSDIPNDRLMRLDECSGAVSVFMHPCGFHNGHSIDAAGRIVACEHGGRRISRLEHDGRWICLADRFDGKRFNSPNDIVVHSDGSLWFTDPTYGIDSDYEGHRADSEIGHSHVFRLDPVTNHVTAVIDDMTRPERPGLQRRRTHPLRGRHRPLARRCLRAGHPRLPGRGRHPRRRAATSRPAPPACSTASASIGTAISGPRARTPCAPTPRTAP